MNMPVIKQHRCRALDHCVSMCIDIHVNTHVKTHTIEGKHNTDDMCVYLYIS